MEGEDLRAALVTPLSGPLARYGRAGADALALWAEREGVSLSVVDAAGDPAAAVRRAEGADLLFGPYGSGPTRAVAAATARVVFNHGGARAAAPHLIPVLAPADTYLVGALHAVPGVRDVRLLHGDTGFGRAVADGAAREARRLGLPVRRGVLPVSGVEGGGAGTLLLVAGGFEEELAAVRRLLPGRWRAAAFVGAGVEEVLAELGDRREGLLGPAQWIASAAPAPDLGPPAADFVAAFRRRTGADPPYPAAQAFAAGLIAARCVRDAGSAGDAALLAAARALDCTTLFGRFRLDGNRQVGHRVLTVQWQEGERRVIWPPEQAEAPFRGR